MNKKPNPNILECRNVTKSFLTNHDTFTVFNNLNLSIRQNEIAIISGKSGAGKTVLLWLLALLDSPSSGKIFFEGTDIGTLSTGELARMRRNKISIIFQDFNLVSSWTASENVRAVFAGSGVKKPKQKEKAGKLLSSIGLKDKLDHLPHELSIGQRQRVAIARSIVLSPRLIIADEPTGGLDPETADEIIRLLLQQVKKNKSSLIIATHGSFPLKIADRVYQLANGILTERK